MNPALANIAAALRAAGVTLTPAQSAAPNVQMGAGITALQGAFGRPDVSDGCGCSGAGPFSEYAPAGLLQIGPLTAPGAQTVAATMNVVGSALPAGSILVLDRVIGTGNLAITEIKSDGAPQAVGQNGVGFAIANLNNQNAPGVYLALRTTRELQLQVQFGAAAVAGDTVVFQVLSKGGRSVQAQACGIS